MVKVYRFFVVDSEFKDEYLYTGWFETTAEVTRFMQENRSEGNIIRVVAFRFSSIDAEEYKALFR